MTILTSDSERTSTRSRKDTDVFTAAAYMAAAGLILQPMGGLGSGGRLQGDVTYLVLPTTSIDVYGVALLGVLGETPAVVLQAERPSDGLRELLADIERGHPPTLAPDRRRLAEETLHAQEAVGAEDVETWARRIADMTSRADD